MEQNCNTPILYYNNTYLIPFHKEFVGKYFEWMQDSVLREQIDSEEMTEEEIEQVRLSYWNQQDSKIY